MTLKELTDAAGIERVIWIDDLFDPPSEITTDVELRALAARAKVRELTVDLANFVLTPDESVEEWLAKITDACDEGMTVDVVLARLRESLTEGNAASFPDYSESAVAEIMDSFGKERVITTGASN